MIPFLLEMTLRHERGLRTHFLAAIPATPAALGPEDLRNIAAYLVLSHSLLEQYFENCARYLVSSSQNKYRRTMVLNRALAGVGMHFGKRLSTSDAISRSDVLGGAVGAAAITFEEKISSNNGLKAKHICLLFETLGFDLSPHNVFVTECDEFGEWRGSFAHRNLPSAVAKNGIDPRVSVNRVEQLFGALPSFSKSFEKFATGQLV
jgi:hypothetical protein